MRARKVGRGPVLSLLSPCPGAEFSLTEGRAEEVFSQAVQLEPMPRVAASLDELLHLLDPSG